MELTKVLHMNGGDSETSYANNSLTQRRVISKTRPIVEEAMRALYVSISPRPSTLVIADLGCSSGPNTFLAVSELIATVEDLCKETGRHEPPEYLVFLNDLPGNDFNAVFRTLPNSHEEHGRCFFTGVPGSFYDRLFPKKTLHFVHSSNSLNWLSQVPEGLESNKGNIYIASNSPQSVIDAYLRQFQNDFTAFLQHRALEMVSGGRMVLTMLGRRSDYPLSPDCSNVWEVLAMALNELVSEGLIEEEKMDTFNIPNYIPSASEVKAEVLQEGSFSINRLEVIEENRSAKQQKTEDGHDSEAAARSMRAATEPLMISHFGQGIIEDVFCRYKRLIKDRRAKEKTELINVIVSLTVKQA